MTEPFEHIKLDPENEEFKNALELVNHTNKIVYLTGKAGTGKTTFLKYLQNQSEKITIVLAPTGVASINSGGQTIHSFFQIPPGPYVKNDKRLRTYRDPKDIDETTIYNSFKYRSEKRKIIENIELLIIDEISMVRCDTLDVIDKLLRVFRKKYYLPFGGVQAVLIGDTFQLPPIAQSEQWEILKNDYKSPFFFSSNVFSNNKPIYIELKTIYRQKEQEFIELLNKIRVNQINEEDLKKLNTKYNPTLPSDDLNNHIIITTTNAQVNQTNSTRLDELNQELQIFKGEVTGEFPKDRWGNLVLPTEEDLHLKQGAQIMILKNDTGEMKRYYNGRIGKVSSLENDKIFVEFSDKSVVRIEKASWSNIQYRWNEEENKVERKTIGVFNQYPLRLAWAITVHKCQGLTFEKVYADLGQAFEDGQVYVALSRCSSFTGLVLKTQIPRSRISTNQIVIDFAKSETPRTMILHELTENKADYYYRQARNNIKHQDYEGALANFRMALKFRNDIESESLRRYFIYHGKKTALYKQKNKFLQNEVTELEQKTQSLKAIQQECTELNLKNEELNKNTRKSIKKFNALIKELEQFKLKLNISQEKLKESELKNFENSKIIIKNELILKLQKEALIELRNKTKE